MPTISALFGAVSVVLVVVGWPKPDVPRRFTFPEVDASVDRLVVSETDAVEVPLVLAVEVLDSDELAAVRLSL